MGMSGGGGQGGVQSEINVTPMVDIMLVLLIIFMVVTPFLQQGITVALPKNMNNPDVDPNIIKESSIVISIPNDGEYYLGKNKVAKEQLTDKVDSMLKNVKKDEDRIVYIKSGVGVSYGDVVTVNCSAVVEALFESELFGHVRGAFTGATDHKMGLIEHAAGGTLFLDEGGELPISIQPKLLRAVEYGDIQRVGSLESRKVDVCIIAATNRDLRTESAAGRFRSDL